MGCLRKIGCLVVLVAAVGVAFWFFRAPSRGPRAESREPAVPAWQALTPAGAQRAKTALERLRAPRGPLFATVVAGDLAAYILQELSRTLPTSADSIEAAAIGDRLCVRAVVRTSDLGDKGSLGPVAMLLGDRERLQLCGVLRIIRPGRGELQVKELKVRELNLPQPLIPRLIRQLSRGERSPDLSPDGLALQTPDYIGDIRVQNGVITLYRASK